MSLNKTTSRYVRICPKSLLLLAAIGSLSVAALALVAPLGMVSIAAYTSLGVIIVGGSAVTIVLCARRLANRMVSQLSLQIGTQVGGLLPLMSLVGPHPFAPLGGSALSPAAAGRLVSLIATERPQTIVELGAGSSTLLLTRLKETLGLEGHIVSIEQDSNFAALVRRQVGTSCSGIVVTAPIQYEQEPTWYDRATVLAAVPDDLDLLIVDGPSDVEGSGLRSPALSALRPKMADRCLIFVDDIDRMPEQRMVEEWQADNPDLSLLIRGPDHAVLQLG